MSNPKKDVSLQENDGNSKRGKEERVQRPRRKREKNTSEEGSELIRLESSKKEGK